MAIILEGIDLPNCSNEDCIVVIRKDKAEVWQTGFKERTVEAIQIPKGHGRLIDADKLRKEFSRTESGYCGYCRLVELRSDGKLICSVTRTPIVREEMNDDCPLKKSKRCF